MIEIRATVEDSRLEEALAIVRAAAIEIGAAPLLECDFNLRPLPEGASIRPPSVTITDLLAN